MGHKHWTFTINNPLSHTIKYDEKTMHCLYYVLQEGEVKFTPHLQGYVCYKKERQHRGALQGLRMGQKFWIAASRGNKSSNVSYIVDDKKGTNQCLPVSHDDGVVKDDDCNTFEQGKRNDIRGFVDAILQGDTDKSLLESHPDCMVRFPQAKKRIRQVYEREQTVETKFPITLFGETIQSPHANDKKRHWLFLSPPSYGKTTTINEVFDGQRVYLAPIDSKYRFEDYDGEPIIIYDDVIPSIEELIEVSNTYSLKKARIGGKRYEQGYWPLKQSRIIIILLNNGPSYITDERFISRFNIKYLSKA